MFQQSRTTVWLAVVISFLIVSSYSTIQGQAAGDAALGTRSYDDYDTPAYCGTSCHIDIYRQWEQAFFPDNYI